MDDYVSKPVQLPDLQGALERFNKELRLQRIERTQPEDLVEY